ncbi:MAG: EAL domain-containing protein [Gammaproteobacteria bacterium]
MIQPSELIPYFQPIVSVASGNIIGYEALARRLDENNQIVSAGSLFFDPDYSDQQMIELDRQVRRKALELFNRNSPGYYLNLNISAAWVDYVDDINSLPTLQMIDEIGIDRDRIIIELMESKGNIDKLISVVRLYKKHGLKVAIDDFGAGFSQLERIMSIKPDIVKLDMRLFKVALKGGAANDVIQMLTQLSRLSGSKIVCESVETDDEFFFGLKCGAQFMQGHLFSPAEEGFKPKEAHERHIASLRQKYLNNTLRAKKKLIEKEKKRRHLIKRLHGALQTDFNLNQLSSYPFEEHGVLCFYICDNEGYQLSSNFYFANSHWFEDPKQKGFNWSWRPYFHSLLAREDRSDPFHSVMSKRYRDINTGQLCKTLAIRLDDERILMADLSVYDE